MLPAAPTGDALQEACNDDSLPNVADYNLTYSAAGVWSGNYASTFNLTPGFNHVTLELSGSASNEVGSAYGTGSGYNCIGFSGTPTNTGVTGFSYLPDGETLMLTNDSATNVLINYLDPVGNAYVCFGIGTTDITLAPGTSITLLRTGVTFAPTTTISGLTAIATPAPSTSLVWYDSETGTNVVTDPTQVGPGTTMLWAASVNNMTGCESATRLNVTLTVNPLPTVTFTAPADLCLDAGVQSTLAGGTATGGVYSGPGVTDDGNGMTYDFDPAAAGVGVHTITYNLTDGNGCASSATDLSLIHI